MIKIQSLTKSFNDVKVLENIQMEIEKGTIYGLLGSNGSGKTTLFKLLTGIYKPDQGKCYIDEKPFEESIDLKDIYFVQEDIILFTIKLCSNDLMKNVFIIQIQVKKSFINLLIFLD